MGSGTALRRLSRRARSRASAAQPARADDAGCRGLGQPVQFAGDLGGARAAHEHAAQHALAAAQALERRHRDGATEGEHPQQRRRGRRVEHDRSDPAQRGHQRVIALLEVARRTARPGRRPARTPRWRRAASRSRRSRATSRLRRRPRARPASRARAGRTPRGPRRSARSSTRASFASVDGPPWRAGERCCGTHGASRHQRRLRRRGLPAPPARRRHPGGAGGGELGAQRDVLGQQGLGRPGCRRGRATGTTWPTASEYLRYVSMDATTTRASTVIRSMPTSETRTQASMTMPLSSTRSRTSMRLVPPWSVQRASIILLVDAVKKCGCRLRRSGQHRDLRPGAEQSRHSFSSPRRGTRRTD